MHFEAKHSYFKKLAQLLGIFINLPYTLASRHQQYQCYLHATVQNEEFPGRDSEVDTGPGKSFSAACTMLCTQLQGKLFLMTL